MTEVGSRLGSRYLGPLGRRVSGIGRGKPERARAGECLAEGGRADEREGETMEPEQRVRLWGGHADAGQTRKKAADPLSEELSAVGS